MLEDQVDLVPIAIKVDFVYHHAEPRVCDVNILASRWTFRCCRFLEFQRAPFRNSNKKNLSLIGLRLRFRSFSPVSFCLHSSRRVRPLARAPDPRPPRVTGRPGPAALR
ncbi:hypothetical protein GUJ93_ZPchr0006g44716 [Zizania palustris]|uniref:Uncharacterized protein n=1 Tax=Zizania palustris TaxID=103762 RepID=A0A8J5W2D7_ZIZPA|nr:hypothetical protein GUJ93_ZPchr0006g44716 [Zizania palustris]